MPTSQEGVSLRPLGDEEYSTLRETMGMKPFLVMPKHVSQMGLRRALIEERKIIARVFPSLMQFGISKDEELVGEANLLPRAYEPGIGEVSYGVIDDYQGNGYATAAVKALTEFGLEQRDLNVVYAKIREGNVGSQRVIKKAGFVPFARQDGILYFEHHRTTSFEVAQLQTAKAAVLVPRERMA